MEIKSLHTHVDIVSRSKGHSVLAKAAYNARDKLRDEYYVKIHDYSKKDDLVFSKIFLPEHIPKEFSDREYLWNSVEKIEKSKNSQLARNLLFTLPRELNEQDRIKLISEFIEENFTSKGMIADCNIHNPTASDNEEQPHAHILLTLREIDEQGNWKPKSRKEYILDENGEKIKLKSGNYKSRKVNLNDWNEPNKAKEWRENFSKKANEYLAKNNIQKRIDPRTFEEQGREELPQIHLGTSSYQMEKKGIQTERGNHNRKIIALNKEFKKLKEEIAEIGSWILSLVNMVKGFLKGFSKEKQEEYNRTPDLFNVYSYLETYYKIQKELSKNLRYDSRMRKEHFDSKKYVNALSYMSSNNLKTIIDIQCKKDEVLTKLKENKESIADCNKQIKNIDTLIKQAKIMRENKTVYDRYKGADNSIFSKIAGASKEEYYNLTDWQLGTDGISKLLFDSDSQFLIGFATAMGDYYVSPITVAEVSDLLGYSQNTNFVQRLNTPSSVLYLMLFYANKLKNACEYSTKCSLSNIDKINDSYEYVFYRRKKNKAGNPGED